MLNKAIFFQKYRSYFGAINQSQADGLNFLLDKLDASEYFNLASEYAYILATIKHECADKWQPVTEMGSHAYLTGKSYYPYIGRGYVQITWRANYALFSGITGKDLVNNPSLALEPETAWQICEYGFKHGSFTGKKLSNYINENSADYYNARRIINGLDQASLIKSYAEKIEDCVEF